ncbi:TPA: hypothetical protein N0F65_006543 [Lagenidium giganteum]|uniref:Protein BFR2 n=1 Tax=Lagenidium giganteum TaxID=4803 RepID=A0AAV2YHL3_9STRA|nr:TPA: hypothetical protein N0F65_006543 [Lagenidium giganteum]
MAKKSKTQQQFDVDAAEEYDDGTRAMTYDEDVDASDVEANENARLASSRKQRLAAGATKLKGKERASALRVKNWDVDMMEEKAYAGKVVKRKDVTAEDGFSSPDEDVMAEWSDAEPFGASDSDNDDDEANGDDDAVEASEDEDSDDEVGGDQDAEKLIRGFEKEDSALLMSKRDSAKIVEKAQHVRHQKMVWERCLEVQIYTKRLLTNTKTIADQGAAEDESAAAAKKEVIAQLYECIDAMSALQDKMCNLPELTVSKESKKRKRNTVEDAWQSIVDSNQHMLSQYNEILNTHSRKTNLSAGTQAKKFKAVNQDILAQVESVLADAKRVKRKAHAPLDVDAGNTTSEEGDEDRLDELMYDDADFYQQLLKEFIESGSSAGGVHDVLAQRAHKKKKKVVNRKASKGRVLRYVVHPKLENFMFPEPYPKPEMDVDELFRSLFGQARQ